MAERKNLPAKLRDAVLAEAGYKCAVPTCGTTLALDIHHIWEVCNGGGDQMDNLLALCPTHHAMYHREIISEASVKRWKTRLIEVNNIGGDAIREILLNIVDSNSAQKRTSDETTFDGFPLAAAEFSSRTCEIGVLWGHNESLFVTTGLCCFVGERIAITTQLAIGAASDVASQRQGRMVVKTMRGMAPFEVEAHYTDENLALIRMGTIDDSYFKTAVSSRPPEIAETFREPLQTKVKYRIVPYVGETVGYLSLSDAERTIRSSLSPFRFEPASVSFVIRGLGKQEFAQYALSAVLCTVHYSGGPVFTEFGALVGIVRETVQLKDELGVRPIVTNVIPLKSLLK